MRWTIERGLSTVLQLIIGMPGESPMTIAETANFAKSAMTISPEQNPSDCSINFAQALPGTSLYEYGRHQNLIGQSETDEEGYLLAVSDKDAHDETTAINFTEYPRLTLQTWLPMINIAVNNEYVRRFGVDHYRAIMRRDATLSGQFEGPRPEEAAYFANPKKALETRGVELSDEDGAEALNLETVPKIFTLLLKGKFGLIITYHPTFAHKCRHLLPVVVLVRASRKSGVIYALKLLGEWIAWQVGMIWKSKEFSFGYRSLRKIVDHDLGALRGDNQIVAPLRKGR
ncbi:MAG: hypothetical protein EB015_21770 [Methylocystaceae bacterium]|nr:hypothetical protein [Methylocystaceae bacterium]